jgi:hypothetical protein
MSFLVLTCRGGEVPRPTTCNLMLLLAASGCCAMVLPQQVEVRECAACTAASLSSLVPGCHGALQYLVRQGLTLAAEACALGVHLPELARLTREPPSDARRQEAPRTEGGQSMPSTHG